MCNHVWREIREQSLIGGHFLSGYKCEICGKYVSAHELTPIGIGGTMSSRVELMGPHGGYIACSNETEVCKRQVYDTETGKLEKIRE